jgi:Dolichyl-phosphate-mannose-protein mannosyltransferase
VHLIVAALVMGGTACTGHLLLWALRLRTGLSWAGNLAISFLAGAGALTMLAFWMSLVAVSAALPVSFGFLVVSTVVVIGKLAVGLARPGLTGAAPRWKRWWVVPLGLLLIFNLVVVVVPGLRHDPGWDGFFVWGIKARYFAAFGGVPGNYFSDLSRDWSHLDYPFLLPLLEAIVYRAIGGVDESTIMVVTAAFTLCGVVLLLELARSLHGALVALVCALVLTTVPELMALARQGMADLPLAVFMLAGCGFVYRWFERGNQLPDLVLGGGLLVMGVWVKREGLLVWAAAVTAIGLWTLVEAIRRRKVLWRPLAAYLPPFALIVPWLLTVSAHHVADPSQQVVAAWLLEHRYRLPAIWHALGQQLLTVRSWGFVWLLVALAAVLKPPLRSPGRAFLLWALCVHFVSVTLIYTSSTWPDFLGLVNSSIDRLVFQVVPLAIFFLATSLLPQGVGPLPRLSPAKRLGGQVG